MDKFRKLNYKINIKQGILKGPSIKLKKLPVSSVLPSELTDFNNSEELLNPQQIEISFKVNFYFILFNYFIF